MENPLDFLAPAKKFHPEDVPVEHMDYQYVEKCNNYEEVRAILEALKSGKEGRFFHLEDFTEKRMLELMPEEEKQLYLRLKTKPKVSEVQEAESEIASFLSNIKATDAAASLHAGHNQQALPPVRGQATLQSGNSVATRVKAEAKEKKQDPKAMPFKDYYRKWDAFDVDGELKALEKEEEAKQQDIKIRAAEAEAELKARQDARMEELKKLNLKVDPATMSQAQREFSANRERQKGNECFNAKEYNDALLYYSRCIAFQPSASALCNRSFANYKLKNFNTAVSDATVAINLDSNFVKGWYRRAQGYVAMGKFLQAIDDLEAALRLDKENKAVLKLLEEAKNKLEKAEGCSVEEFRARGSAPSKKSTRVAIIEESDDEEEEEEGGTAPAMSESQPPKASTRVAIIEESDSEEEEEETAKGVSAEAVPKAAAASKPVSKEEGSAKPKATRIAIEEDSDSEEEAAEATAPSAPTTASTPSTSPQQATGKATRVAIDESDEEDEAQPAEPPKPASAPQSATSPSEERKQQEPTSPQTASAIAKKALKGKVKVPKPPKTAYEFERTISALKAHPQATLDYLKQFNTKSVWKKLKRCPEPETLGRVIAAVAKAVAKDVEEQSDKQTSELVGTLSFIPTVPEFDMACMMLTENDQQGLRKIIAMGEQLGAVSPSQSASLKKNWNL